MKFLLVALFISFSTFASDKECEKKCKSDYEDCRDKVHYWAQDKYIEIEGLAFYSINCDVDDSYNQVRKQEKAMKRSCKEVKKECLKACEEN